MHDAVLFDLDGTLLDTLDDLADAMNAVLAAEGLPTHPTDAYRHFVGDGVVALARRAVGADRADDERFVDHVVARMRAEYADRWDAKTRPYDGVAALLDALTDRGVRRAVLSNKPHDTTCLCVTGLLGRWTFDAVRGVSDATPRKPEPAGALAIARELGIPPERWLYVGDTNTDMRTAAAAGMYAAGAVWGFRDADELTAAGANALAQTPTDVLELL
ncbi:MAG: HAD family hydrolase [Phycisphaerae bacterium]|nr:HAD family hydrolase [Phycisphaerae bacterium]